MSRAEKQAPGNYDPVSAEAEARRREDLANSGAYQAGVAQAKAQAIANCHRALDGELATLKRATVTRDANIPSRDKYDRTHSRVVKAAERLALATNRPVSDIPAWLPPPAPTPESTMTIGVPKAAPVTVHQMKDKGEPLTSLPVFGSRAWMTTQGSAK